jgi:hypothetical protein
MGKHSKLRRRDRDRQVVRWPPKGLIEMVDVRSGENHLLTLDAAAAGRQAPHHYRAQCGKNVIPAALVDPGTGRYCKSCLSSVIPASGARK